MFYRTKIVFMDKIIFGTNNKRKIEDLRSILNELNYKGDILSEINEAEGAMLLKEGYQKQIAASIKTAVEAYYAGE